MAANGGSGLGRLLNGLRRELLVNARSLCVDPIGISSSDFEVRPVLESELQDVEAGIGRLRAKAQNVVVRQVVRNLDQVTAKQLGGFEGEIFAAGKLRDRFGNVSFESIAC